MLMLSAGSVNELFTDACRAVLATGKLVAPRGLATVEVLGACFCLTDPRRRFVDVPPVRILNPAFAAAEAMWILSGSGDSWIYDYNQRLTRYADHGRLMGAYGPRLRRWHGTADQLTQVHELLREDPDSRRAVVQLFDPVTDFQGYKDVPCTLGYRFFLRDGLLEMHTTMRSQDLWLGFCYDIFTATVIQEVLAGWLGAGLGSYHHHVDSLHLYARDLPAARCLPPVPAPGPAATPLSAPCEDFDGLLQRVIAGEPLVTRPGWAEIAVVLASYRCWKAGDRLTARLGAARVPGPLTEVLSRWYDHLEQGTHTLQPGPQQAGGNR